MSLTTACYESIRFALRASLSALIKKRLNTIKSWWLLDSRSPHETGSELLDVVCKNGMIGRDCCGYSEVWGPNNKRTRPEALIKTVMSLNCFTCSNMSVFCQRQLDNKPDVVHFLENWCHTVINPLPHTHTHTHTLGPFLKHFPWLSWFIWGCCATTQWSLCFPTGVMSHSHYGRRAEADSSTLQTPPEANLGGQGDDGGETVRLNAQWSALPLPSNIKSTATHASSLLVVPCGTGPGPECLWGEIDVVQCVCVCVCVRGLEVKCSSHQVC